VKLGLECIHCGELSFTIQHAVKHNCSFGHGEILHRAVEVTWSNKRQSWVSTS